MENNTKEQTLNFFCLGTGEKINTKNKTIIHKFHEECKGDKYIYDGPKWDGTGVEKNVAAIKEEIIKHAGQLKENEKLTINLTGFSRGAVTCIAVANAIAKADLGQDIKEKIKFNIFAIDPVAGLTDKRKDEYRTVPKSVENFTAVYQEHEMRREFKPQDLTRLKFESFTKTNINFKFLPGNHSDAVKIKKDTLKAAPMLNWLWLKEFLENNGTQFTKTPEYAFSDKYKTAALSGFEEDDIRDLKLLIHNKRDSNKRLYEKVMKISEKNKSKVKFSLKEIELLEQYLEKLPDLKKKLNQYKEQKSNEADLLQDAVNNKFAYEERGKKLKLFDGAPFVLRTPRKILSEKEYYKNPHNYKFLNPILNFNRNKSQFKIFEKKEDFFYTKKALDYIVSLPKDSDNRDEIITFLNEEIIKLHKVYANPELIQLYKGLAGNQQQYAVSSTYKPVKIFFDLIIESIKFATSLGHIGGGILSTAGLFLHNLDKRIKDTLGDIGYNPLKLLIAIPATILELVGIVLINRMGLKLIETSLVNLLKNYRDCTIEILQPKDLPISPQVQGQGQGNQ